MSPLSPFRTDFTPTPEELVERAETRYYYRYYDVTYSPGVNEYGDRLPGPGQTVVRLELHKVLRTTPKGVWIAHERGFGKPERFIKAGTRKQFAHPTLLEARHSFMERKKAQRRIYLARAATAANALVLAASGCFDDTSLAYHHIPDHSLEHGTSLPSPAHPASRGVRSSLDLSLLLNSASQSDC